MANIFNNLSLAKISAGLLALQGAGMRAEHWIRMTIADDEAMEQLLLAWPGVMPDPPSSGNKPRKNSDTENVLAKLSLKAIMDGLQQLERAGLQDKHWDTLCQSNLASLERSVRNFPGAEPCPISISYDAETVSRVLGIKLRCEQTAPEPATTEEVVIYYGGWSYDDLLKTSAGKQALSVYSSDKETRSWNTKAGYYRLLRMPPTRSEFAQQEIDETLKHLQIAGPWVHCPTPVLMTAVLVHMEATGLSLLRNQGYICNSNRGMNHLVYAAGGKMNVSDHNLNCRYRGSCRYALAVHVS